MRDIKAIMDLAPTIEPGCKLKPQFKLWSDSKGQWHAQVALHKYFVLVEDQDTAEDALAQLRAELVKTNQGFLKRMTDALKKWTGTGTPVLRLVKDTSSASED